MKRTVKAWMIVSTVDSSLPTTAYDTLFIATRKAEIRGAVNINERVVPVTISFSPRRGKAARRG